MQIPRPSGRMKASVDLEAWLSTTGKRQVDVVTALEVSKQLVSVWVTGRGVPGLENAEALERLTNGAVKVLDWRVPASGGGETEIASRELVDSVRARLTRLKQKARRKRGTSSITQ